MVGLVGQDTVAVLGTGTMGAGMARNLAAAGLPLRVWNRSPERAEALKDVAQVASTPAEAVDGADLVLTMLWDAEAVAEVMHRAAPALAPETIWVQTSTVGLDGVERLAAMAAEHRSVFVDAPVLGTRKPAEDGTLVVLASGPDEVRDRCTPVFDAIGSRTLWVGPAGAGSRLKLVVNSWVLTVVEGVAECMALADALGLDPALFLAALKGGGLDAPYVGAKGGMMVAGEYPASFTVEGAAKDAGLVMAAARSAGAQVGVLERIAEHFDRAVAAGLGDLDLAATYLAHKNAIRAPDGGSPEGR